MNRILVVSIALGLVGCQSPDSGSQRVVARDRTVQRTVQPGRNSRLYTFANFMGRSCQPNPNILVTIGIPPKHGQAETRPETVVPTEHTSLDHINCNDPTPGTAVRYRPAPGYHGPDSLVVQDGDQTVTFDILVE